VAGKLKTLVRKLQSSSGEDVEVLLSAVDLTEFFEAPESDWAAFFATLVELWRGPDPEVAKLALHWLGAGTWMASLRNGPVQAGFPHEFPIDAFLVSARIWAARGDDNVYRLFADMQSTFRHLEQAPRPIRRLYDMLTTWLQKLSAHDPHYRKVQPGLIEAAQTAFLPMQAWPTARDLLLRRAASSEHDIARSAAAWRLGQFYLAAAEQQHPLDPPLAEMAARLADMDVERPGVAGPFLSTFFSEFDYWREAGGPEPSAYVLAILERRREPEPNTLPVALGIDYLTQELLHTPDHIRHLAAMGRRDFAEAVAHEAGLDLEAELAEA
jgi:hypothetical protein